jgi:hypothetical protein
MAMLDSGSIRAADMTRVWGGDGSRSSRTGRWRRRRKKRRRMTTRTALRLSVSLSVCRGDRHGWVPLPFIQVGSGGIGSVGLLLLLMLVVIGIHNELQTQTSHDGRVFVSNWKPETKLVITGHSPVGTSSAWDK